jgi:hypothetical protein
MCREYKWEQDRQDDNQYYYDLLVENRDILYLDILYEFQLANKYFKLYTLSKELLVSIDSYVVSMNEFKYLYKNDLINNKYIDFKLINILLLPDDIVYIIFKFLFIALTKEAKLPLII